MKLEFILNIIKAIIKVEGLSKAVMVMGDLRGSFFSSWDLQVFWLDSSEHKNNSRSLYFTDFLLWPGAQEATQSHVVVSVRLWVCDICEFITQSSCCLSPASDSCFSAVSQNSPSNLFGLQVFHYSQSMLSQVKQSSCYQSNQRIPYISF